MDKTMRIQPLVIFLTLIVSGLPAYGGYCSAEEFMYEYKNNNEYINDPRSPLWGRGFRNPEYKPKLTEWIQQTPTRKAVVDGKNELRCRYGGEVSKLLNTLYTESYTCGPIKILHTRTRENLTFSYALVDRKNNEFPLKHNMRETNDERCRCVNGPTNTTRTTICTQKLYNEYVNIDFIQEIPEIEITKPRPQI